ncbi:MAG: hypothetical protein WBN81_04450 [Gammaproteobacteria bacterium]
MEQLPDKLSTEKNHPVLEYTSGQSAHSDVANALEIAIAPLGEAHTYCPDSDNYRYLIAYANDTVFSYAAGMRTVAFRLSSGYKQRAIEIGGEAVNSIGKEWVAFELFRGDRPEVDVRFWPRKVYLFALGADVA